MLADTLAWEASYQIWLRRVRGHEGPWRREVWCGHGDTSWREAAAAIDDSNALLSVRVQQATRWLRLEERERKRQATIAARRSA